MIRTLRAFFLTRALREKVLLAGFILLGVLMWFSSFNTRLSLFLRQEHSTTRALADQKQWLDGRKGIEAEAQKAASSFVPANTLDSIRLLSVVQSLSAEAGLGNTQNRGNTDTSSGQFSIHTLDYSINNAEWPKLMNFYLGLSKRSPYIAIEGFSAQRIANNPSQLNIALRISSVEMTSR